MPFSLCLLSSSVWGSISADKTLPGGGTDVTLTSIWASYPCSGSHTRCSTQDNSHYRPLTAWGCYHKKKKKEKKSSPPQDPRAVMQHRHQSGCCFHWCYMCVCVREREVPVSYQTGPLGSFEVFPLCFNTLLPSWRSHTRTPIWKTNTNDGNASIWCKLVRKCSLEIIISRYVSRWFQRVTQRAALWHSDWCHSTYFILFKLSSKLVVLVILKVWEPSRPLGVKPNVPILALFDGLIDTDEQLWINSCII